MRARKEVYEMAKRFRAEKNGRIIEEPRERVMFDSASARDGLDLR